MQSSVRELDALCARLDRLAEGLVGASGAGPLAPVHEEQAVEEAVQLIQRIGESIAWAYGQHHNAGLGEAFAQPFVDRRLRERLKALLGDRLGMRREVHGRVAAQVLQTIHILLQATPAESTLFCNLTAGWYLNDVAATRLDFRGSDDLLPLWMTVVKDIATMLNKDNLMLFFDPSSHTPFPIFTEAVRFYHHPVSQVRTHVQAASLEIFLKLRDEDVWAEPLFELVLAESASFFTHVCCLLREFWHMVDEAFRAGVKRDLRSALYIQNDILMYINDVFACDIPRLSQIMQEKLLRFAVVPVLLRSVVLQRPSAGERAWSEGPGKLLSPPVAFYLLHDLLATLRSAAVLDALAALMLRSELPEGALQLVASAPPRTPSKYFAIQASWGGGPALAGAFDPRDLSTDEALYAMPATTVVELLHAQGGGSFTGASARNWCLDALEEWLRSLDHAAERGGLAALLLGACARLLAAMRAGKEVLDVSVAERIGSALSQALGIHHQLQWATLAVSLRTLRELALAADVPPGRAGPALAPPLRERVLNPLATELLHMLRRYGGDVQEAWLQEFQEQWAAHSQTVSPLELPSPRGQREMLELNVAPELPGAAEGRTKCIRVLFGAWRFCTSLLSSSGEDPFARRLPGLCDEEADETSRYQLGVPVYIGKMNRVKCLARGLRGAVKEEALYLLPMQATLVLVRPDDMKPFWAVPVVSEPLRATQLRFSQERPSAPLANISAPQAAQVDEAERTLTLEVRAPRSPALAGPAAVGSSTLLVGRPPLSGDRVANTVAGLAGPAPAAALSRVGSDPMAMSLPSIPMRPQDRTEVGSPPPMAALTLVFADERRHRVACKFLAQARQAAQVGLLGGLGAFLTEVAGG